MKKSQILAALALAFALGVVAPVATTTTTVSAFTVANDEKDIEGSATKAEVLNAVAAVKANTTYKNIMALDKVIEAIEDGDYDEIATATTGTDLKVSTSTETTVKGMYDALVALDSTYYTAEVATIDAKNISISEKIEAVIALAQKADDYKWIAPIYIAKADENSQAFRNAVSNFSGHYGVTISGFSSNTKYDDTTIMSAIESTIEAELKSKYQALDSSNSGDNTLYGAMVTAVYEAENANESFNQGLSAILSALKASGVMVNGSSTDGKGELKTLETSYDKGTFAFVLSDLVTSFAENADDTNYTTWMNVDKYVENAEDYVEDNDNEYNYGLVVDLATAYRTAMGNTRQTIEEVAQSLVGYTPTTDPTVTNTTVSNGPVSVTGPFKEGYGLEVVKSDMKVAAFGDSKYSMWDINIVDGDKNVVKIENTSVMVSIDVPEGFDAAKSSIYHVSADGKAVDKLASRVENGKLVFVTSHFSYYAIVEDNGANFGISAPDTGALATTEGTATTAVAMVAGIATALTAAGAGVVAYRNARRSTRK